MLMNKLVAFVYKIGIKKIIQNQNFILINIKRAIHKVVLIKKSHKIYDNLFIPATVKIAEIVLEKPEVDKLWIILHLEFIISRSADNIPDDIILDEKEK